MKSNPQAKRERGGKPVNCRWKYDENDDAWATSCGLYWTLNEGTPAENHIRFCFSCGKRVRIHPKGRSGK